MAAKEEVDLAFAKIAVLRRQVSQEQVQECFRQLGHMAMQGKESSLATIMVEKSMLPQTEADAIVKMVELGQVVPELPGYTLLFELGRGGMGAVYKGLQTALDRAVAIKILFPELARNERYLTRFLNEAKAVARLQHPNIVSAIDVGEAGGFHYFAMEFVEGQTLAGLLKDKTRLDEAYALDLVLQTARGLEHAWKHKLVHRDVKPENIILSNDGTAKLADLGIAKQVDADTSLTMDGGVVGSPNYISPEQANGAKDIDTRSDIYSLGATLYCLLSGEPPFKGDTAAVVMAQHMVAKVPDIREKTPGISAGTAQLIQRMMSKDRAQRPDDPATLIKEIEAVKAQMGKAGAPAAAGGDSLQFADEVATTKAPPAQGKAGSQAGMASVARPKGLGKGGPGSRGSSAEMRRIGTAEVRALTSKEAGRLNRKSSGLDPMVWVGIACAGIGAVVLFFVMKADKQPIANVPVNTVGNVEPPDNGSPTPGNTEVPVPTETPQEREARESFEFVTKFERENPNSLGEILEKFAQVHERHVGTAWGFKAEEAVKRVTAQYREILDRDLADLDRAIGPMMEQNRFADVKKEFEKRFPPDKVPVLIRADVELRWAQVLETADARFNSAVAEAERHVEADRHADAIGVYDKVLETFGLPQYVSAARGRQEAARKAAELAVARKAAEKEQQVKTRFADRMKAVRDLVQTWDFAKAIQTIDQEKGFKDTPLAEEWSQVRKDLERLEKFKKGLIANVAAKKVKVDTKIFMGDAMPGTLSGASEKDFDVSPKGGGKMTFPWSKLKPEESFNLAKAAADRADPVAGVALATFAMALGLPDKAAGELRGNHPDVAVMQKRLEAAAAIQEQVEIDSTLGRATNAMDFKKFDEAAQLLDGLMAKSEAKLTANQKVLVEGMRRQLSEGHADQLLARAQELKQSNKVKEAGDTLAELLTKYPESRAASSAAGVLADLEESTVLRVCTFEPAQQRPWRWSNSGAGFDLDETRDVVKEGKFSGKVTYPAHKSGSYPCIRFAQLPKKDWSSYNTFALWIHAPEKTGDRLGIRLFVDGEAHKFSYDFTVDWEGWKELRIPFKNFATTGNAAWSRVQEIAVPIIEGKGGVYHIDDVRALKDGT